MRAVADRLEVLDPALVAVQSTGGLETALLAELWTRQIPVAPVNPGRVREFAKSLGLLAKIDQLDVKLLARYGKAAELQPTNLPAPDIQHLSPLLSR